MQNSLYETHNIAESKLPLIFHHNTVSNRRALFSNWHENIELIRHISGNGFALIDSNRVDMENGNITVINSNLIHAFGSDTSVSYDCLIIDKHFFLENGIDIDKISFSPTISTESTVQLFKELAHLVDSFRESPKQLDIARIRAALLSLIIELCEKHGSEALHSQYSAEKIKEIISYINNNVSSPLTLDEISKQAKMSKYHLCREFKSLTGSTVFEFINTVRCRTAKQKIRSGTSVSEAAFAVGFESLSYFTKKFKEITGKLPSEYKKEAE